MSWVEWMGEAWPSTVDDVELRVHLAASDTGNPRQYWSLALTHKVPLVPPNRFGRYTRALSLEIGDLGLRGAEWQELNNVSIRSTAEWYDEIENEEWTLRLVDPLMRVSLDCLGGGGIPGYAQSFVAHGFVVTVGNRSGYFFTCEIEAWMLAEEQFYRTHAESSEELSCFGAGPPNLRMLSRAFFTGGSISMERCGVNPVPEAMKRFRDHTGCGQLNLRSLEWAVQGNAEFGRKPELAHGGRSTVHFVTPASQ